MTTLQLPWRIRPAAPISDDDLYELCQANRELRIERTADGEIVIMPPTGGETGRRNFDLIVQFGLWSRTSDGVGFDSSTGFLLPNGAERSPDLAWVRSERWDALSPGQRERFVPLCPDFVIELRSPSDSLDEQRDKMVEYMSCGCQLGWLLDPTTRQVHVYRAGAEPEILDDPQTLSGEPLLSGLRLDLTEVW